MKRLFIFIQPLFFLWLLIPLRSGGQQSAYFEDPPARFRSALDLMEKEQFGQAREHFRWLQEHELPMGSRMLADAILYEGICAYELYHPDASRLLNGFIEKYPSDTRISDALFYLGKQEYRNRKWHSASRFFEKVDPEVLPDDSQDEYSFKWGYCYFQTEKFEEALRCLTRVKDGQGKYAAPACYYSGHIYYIQKSYDKALDEFMRLETDENFGSIVPYYILQIRFMQGDYNAVIRTGPALLEVATPKRTPEIARFTGLAYIRTAQYEKGLPYLLQFHESEGVQPERPDLFELGYALYRTGDHERASEYFEKAANGRDTIAQYAYYYLGDCYLQTGKRQFAGNAFMSSFKLGYDQDIREDALFLQAQLAYELSFDPYSEAIKSLKQYLNEYPDSPRNDEAYQFLYDIAISTGNYTEALLALERMKEKGQDHAKKLQKALYFKGVDLFHQQQFKEAADTFIQSAEAGPERDIAAAAYFWAGEAFFRNNEDDLAENYFRGFLRSPGAFHSDLINPAYYSLGYVLFRKKQYDEALIQFSKFTGNNQGRTKEMLADAYVRSGDCYFIRKDFQESIRWYDRAVDLESGEVDYALYQKALALGVLQKNDEKVRILQEMMVKYPRSTLLPDALYESGNTWLLLNDPEKGLMSFRKIITDYPASSHNVKAHLKSGLIYYNMDQNDLALSFFEKVVSGYPGTPESKEALVSIRNIYMAENRVDEFFRYVQNLAFADITQAEQDSITYMAAENQFMKGNCTSARISLEKYLERFPEGAYIAHASFYAAECYSGENNRDKALELYLQVIGLPRSRFTETALLKTARILLEQGRYEQSLNYFGELEQIAESRNNLTEARYGKMICSYRLEQYDQAIQNADILLTVDKISDEWKIDALLIRASSMMSLDRLDDAEAAFREVTKISRAEAGAEAKYNLARIEYVRGELPQAEKTVFELINQFAAHDYWVASGFILLADIYVQAGNLFQAKQTLQSIIDNYEGKDLITAARLKKEEIERQEESERMMKAVPDTMPDQPDQIEIDEGKIPE
ncbi:MAG: tetratricopeptide repeat protein [Bacteroidales bacterium]|nr:tetratricopeptide repeat protein [Bacteroidales bacterium]